MRRRALGRSPAVLLGFLAMLPKWFDRYDTDRYHSTASVRDHPVSLRFAGSRSIGASVTKAATRSSSGDAMTSIFATPLRGLAAGALALGFACSGALAQEPRQKVVLNADALFSFGSAQLGPA